MPMMTSIPSLAAALAAIAQADGPTAPTFWMPTGASTIAPGVDRTLDVINWICYVFFALVMALDETARGAGGFGSTGRG